MVSIEPEEDMPRVPLFRKSHSCMPDKAAIDRIGGGKQLLVANNADLRRLGEHFEHRFQPTWLDDGIVIQKEQVLTVCRPGTAITTTSKEEVAWIADVSDARLQ
jgi:hypothetical protein